MNNISLNGSGSIACGKDAIAVGERGVAVKGNLNNNIVITGDKNVIKNGPQNKAVSSDDSPTHLSKNQPKRVFISYSHDDADVAQQLKSGLEKNEIECIIDTKTFTFGGNISSFIEDAIRTTDFTITIISKASLRSSWVIKEYLETRMHEHVQGALKFIPVYIDKSLFDNHFFIDCLKSIQKDINELKELMNEDVVKDVKIPNLTTQYDRLMTLKHGLGEFLNTLNNSLAADFSSESSFNENMDQLVSLIKNS